MSYKIEDIVACTLEGLVEEGGAQDASDMEYYRYISRVKQEDIKDDEYIDF